MKNLIYIILILKLITTKMTKAQTKMTKTFKKNKMEIENLELKDYSKY